MTYEPSKELIEQIAEEYWDLELGASEGKFENASVDDEEYFCGLAEDWSNLPTIRKALELYETIPAESKKYCRQRNTNGYILYSCPHLDWSDEEYYCSFSDGIYEYNEGHIKCPDCPRPYKGEE